MKLDSAFGLRDRVCVVTGGGSGIGRGIALALAREAAKVVILDRDLPAAQETLALVEQDGAQGIALSCDTSDAGSVVAAQAAMATRLGDADLLVNNAGVVGGGTLADLSIADWNALLAVNLTGYFLCAQIFGAPMRQRGAGAIVHVSSITARETMGGIGAYGIAKAGVTMLSRSLAAEWGPDGVRSNVVHPGLIQTPMTQASYDDPAVAQGRAAAVPLGRVGQPDDIAQTVLFLASPRAAYINGAELLVDGGLSPNLIALVPKDVPKDGPRAG
jgi:NAD(P)-dependent dehydrogenase (short-subunit alcohol dehydrogenase family)